MAKGLKINQDQKDPVRGGRQWGACERARRWRDVSAAGGGEKEEKDGRRVDRNHAEGEEEMEPEL